MTGDKPEEEGHKVKVRANGLSGEGRRRSRSGVALMLLLAVIAAVFIVILADCGCKEEGEQKQDGPMEVEEQQSTYDQPASESASQAALDEALQQGKPVFLNFHSNQCVPCIEMEKVIEEVEPEYADQVKFIVVDVYDPSEMGLCNNFQVQLIPTSFFIDSSGQVIEAYEGLIDAPMMREILNSLVSGTG